MKTLIIAAVLLGASVADATQIVAPGFTLNVLGPTLPGGSTTSTVAAVDPSTDNVWMSNGITIFRLDGSGGIAETEQLRIINGGGPLIDLTTDLVFDASGAMYVTDYARPGTDIIYKRPVGGSWAPWTAIDFTRAMQFDPSGDMIVLSTDGDLTGPGKAWRVTPDGTATQFGTTTNGESFVLDPVTGDMLIPHFLGTGIDRMTMDGTLTTMFSWARDDVALYQGIAVTAAGNIFVGVHKNTPDEVEYDEIIRINGISGLRELIVSDANENPVDMLLAGDLLVAGFGSLVPLGLSGDLDAPLLVETIAIPEPSTGLLAVLGLGFLARRRFSLTRAR